MILCVFVSLWFVKTSLKVVFPEHLDGDMIGIALHQLLKPERIVGLAILIRHSDLETALRIFGKMNLAAEESLASKADCMGIVYL